MNRFSGRCLPVQHSAKIGQPEPIDETYLQGGLFMPASWVDMNVGGQTMEGYLTQPEAQGRYPAVIIIQEIWGVNSHIQSVTERLPSQG
jgi:hypothetical protein